jgi:hypothetical protein
MFSAGNIGVQGGEVRKDLAVLDFPGFESDRFPALDHPVEWMQFCGCCQEEHVFAANRFCASGLIGCCSNCRDERVAPFTRTNSEAA